MKALSLVINFAKFGRSYMVGLDGKVGTVSVSADMRPLSVGKFSFWPPVENLAEKSPALELLGDLGCSPTERADLMDEMSGRLLGAWWALNKKGEAVTLEPPRAQPFNQKFTPARSSAARFILEKLNDRVGTEVMTRESWNSFDTFLEELRAHAGAFPAPAVDAAQAALFDGADGELRADMNRAALPLEPLSCLDMSGTKAVAKAMGLDTATPSPKSNRRPTRSKKGNTP